MLQAKYLLVPVWFAFIWGPLVTDLLTQLPLPMPCILRAVDIPQDRLPLPKPITSNTRLKNATRLFEGKIYGSESVAVGSDGTLYMLDRYGFLFTAHSSSDGEYTLNTTPEAYLGPGRPLGFHLDHTGRYIYVCNSLQGLLRYDLESREITIVSNIVSLDSPYQAGAPITYANDLHIASDGSIYFTASNSGIPPAFNRFGFYDTMQSYLLTAWQGGATGKLLHYTPADGKTHVVTEKGIWFANGVALSSDESYALIVETPAMRVLRHWLKGDKAGTTEVFVENLPAFPDGVTRSKDGTFWLALVVPNMPIVGYVNRLGKYGRWAVAWLLQVFKVPQKKMGLIMQLDPSNGRVLQHLMDPDGLVVSTVSAVTEYNSTRLFLGNLGGNYVSYIDLP